MMKAMKLMGMMVFAMFLAHILTCIWWAVGDVPVSSTRSLVFTRDTFRQLSASSHSARGLFLTAGWIWMDALSQDIMGDGTVVEGWIHSYGTWHTAPEYAPAVTRRCALITTKAHLAHRPASVLLP